MDDQLVEAYQVQLWILQGKKDQAERWIEENQLEKRLIENVDQPRFDPIWEIHSQTLARVYLSQENYVLALQAIEPLLKVAEANNRLRTVLKILAMQAVIFHSKGESETALQVLEGALILAEPESFVRTFLDEGEQMVQLLNKAVTRGNYPVYAKQLLAAHQKGLPAGKLIKSKLRNQTELVEPLSEREIEVLQLIAKGLSNQEIVRQLHISLSTVKGHTSNIYGKLGVHKRTQAVSRGMELGIISAK
jgi:LuxR family maltose regulon positive regulatory protein